MIIDWSFIRFRLFSNITSVISCSTFITQCLTYYANQTIGISQHLQDSPSTNEYWKLGYVRRENTFKPMHNSCFFAFSQKNKKKHRFHRANSHPWSGCFQLLKSSQGNSSCHRSFNVHESFNTVKAPRHQTQLVNTVTYIKSRILTNIKTQCTNGDTIVRVLDLCPTRSNSSKP